MYDVMQAKKSYHKKADRNTKIGKYFMQVKSGKTKKDSQIIAGFSDTAHAKRIEATKTFQALEQKYYKDELQDIIKLKEIAQEQVKVIKQDKDLGAKNTAIKQALEKLEPTDNEQPPEKVLVVLR